MSDHDQRFAVTTTVHMHDDGTSLTAEITWRPDMNDDPVTLVSSATEGLAHLMRDELVQPSLDAKALRELRQHVRFARESLDLRCRGDDNAVTRALRDLEEAVFEDGGDNLPAVRALADSWFGLHPSEASPDDLRDDDQPGGAA